MNVTASPKLDVAAGTVTCKTRRHLGLILIGCAGLLGAGLLALEQWRGGQAFPHDSSGQTELGALANSARHASLPTENRLQPRMGQPTVASNAMPFRRSLAERLVAIRAVTDRSAQEELLENLADSIAVDDLAKALAFLESQEASELTQSLGVQLLRRWAAGSPLAAATWVGSHPGGANRQDEIRAVALVWADQSLPEALAWVNELPEIAERNTGLVALAYEAARAAPMEAFRIAEELPDGQARNDLIRHTANQWGGQNPREAVAWARQVEDETLRQQLLAGITMAWAAKEPAAAANAAATLLPPGRAQGDAVVGIVQRWVQTEPGAAAAWVMDFPGGPLQDAACEELVKLWVDQDQAGTDEWIRQLDVHHRDPAVAAYVDKLALSFPDSAAAWASTIGDETLRSRLLKAVVASWMTSDPAAAYLWVATADLTETTRAQLLKSARN